MSCRYYVSQVLPPEPTPPPDPETTPWKNYWRLAIDDASPRVAFAAHIPTLPNGTPSFPWGIAFAKGEDWSGVDADPRNIRLFDSAEGEDKAEIEDLIAWSNATAWRDVGVVRRNRIRATLANWGVETGDITNATSMRAILQKIGRFLHPTFDETKLFVR